MSKFFMTGDKINAATLHEHQKMVSWLKRMYPLLRNVYHLDSAPIPAARTTQNNEELRAFIAFFPTAFHVVFSE
jgi:hypothetical protein